MSPAEGAWEEWLAASLTELSIDADVFGPYVTGLMEDVSLPGDERASSVLELLNEASPTGAVEAGTVERLERRWTERCQQESAAVAKAESEVLAKYAADRAAQKAADEANKLRGGALGDTVAGLSQLEKRRLMAQLDAGASSSDEDAHDGEDVDEERGKAEVQRAREEVRQRVEQRREAITKAVEREDRRKAEHELRRAVREQAGHTSGRGNKDKDGGTPSNGKGKGRGTH